MSRESSLFTKSELPSLNKLKQTKVLCFCGMMGALAVILGYVATIKIGQYIRIGFSGPSLLSSSSHALTSFSTFSLSQISS